MSDLPKDAYFVGGYTEQPIDLFQTDCEKALTEANKLLEQTIEVLEGYVVADNSSFGPYHARGQWWFGKAKPLLDNLKALTKEGTE